MSEREPNQDGGRASAEYPVPDADVLTAALTPADRERFPCVVALDDAGSTNDIAWEMQRQGLPDGTVVLARTQTAGRGRLGRTWISLPGNLHLSVLRQMREPADRSAIVTLLCGLALARAVEAVAGVRPDLKWPNDLLVHGRKLAGILVEAREGWQVLGLGLNVNAPMLGTHITPSVSEGPRVASPALMLAPMPGTPGAPLAVSLLDLTGRRHSLEALAARFLRELRELEAQMQAEDGLPAAAYLSYFPSVGRSVTVQCGAERVTGRIAGVAADGALELDTREGPRRILSGEVIHVEEGV